VSETVTVYYDYLCPFSWRAAEIAEVVTRELGTQFRWHHFSTYQSRAAQLGNGHGNGQLWNERIDPNDASGGRGLMPFLASCAARQQGAEAYRAFRLAAMRAYHRECRPYTREVLLEVARDVGLHLPSFERDLANPERRTVLANEHHQAASLNVMTTPTFHFSSGHLGDLRITVLPPDPVEIVSLFQTYRTLLESYPYLESIQRPRARSN
jgi:predicted DsbA family dithiol-disulfide isomerase